MTEVTLIDGLTRSVHAIVAEERHDYLRRAARLANQISTSVEVYAYADNELLALVVPAIKTTGGPESSDIALTGYQISPTFAG